MNRHRILLLADPRTSRLVRDRAREIGSADDGRFLPWIVWTGGPGHGGLPAGTAWATAGLGSELSLGPGPVTTRLQRLAALLRRLSPSAMLVQPVDGQLWALWCRSLLHGLPLVCLADQDADFRYSQRVRWVRRILDPLTSRHVTSCASLREQLLEEGIPEERITVIPPGQEALRRTWRPDPKRVLVAACAGDDPLSGGRYLVEAVARLAEERPELFLRVWDDGSGTRDLRQRALRSRIGDRVELLSRATGQPEELARGADIWAEPALRGGVPSSLLAAMAVGLPVLGFRVPGVEDRVRNNRSGLLTFPGDTFTLCEHLDRMVADSAWRARLGQAGREDVLAHHEMRRTRAAWTELLAPLV